MPKEISILVGGKAGDGIKQAGNFIGRLLNRIGWRVFIYEDYPSLITGGHNFSVIRAGEEKVYSHRDKVDVVIALNEDAIEKHKDSLKEETIVIYDSDLIKEGEKDWIGIPMTSIAKENNLPLIVRNTISLGAFAASIGVEFGLVEKIIRDVLRKKIEENIKVSEKGYNFVKESGKSIPIEKLENKEPLPLLTGNEAVALGAVKGGMKLYVAYPMTPASSILHFLAKNQEKLKILTVQPESEISVILMAEGAAASGVRTMIGTSGGGFALMTEALSLAGQAEIPIVIVLSQRAGPSTGVPTYTMQGDLPFALSAGHGEFLRVVVAPGDPEETFYWGARAMNFAWKFQIPVILMLDKHLSESTFSSEIDERGVKEQCAKLWDKKGEYERYKIVSDGISPMAFYGQKNAVVKYNSYEHDEFGITTEDPDKIEKMIDKRLSKQKYIIEEMKKEEAIKIYGDRKSRKILITWGSTKGVVKEVGEELGLKVIQVVSLEPFPVWALKKELDGAEIIIDVEVNATAPLAKLLDCNGLFACEKILKYNARPFTFDELKEKVLEKIK